MTTKRKKSAGVAGASAFGPRQILVPTDFSYPAEQALKHALAIAKRYRARVALVHIVGRITIPDMVFAAARVDMSLLNRLAAERLERLVTRFKLKPSHQLVKEGNAAEEVVKLAKRINADLVVISSRGHSALERLVIGSTAERIVQHSTCPVLVVPVQSPKPKARKRKKAKQRDR